MQILTPADGEWQEAYERLPIGKRDVFYAPGFAKACSVGLYDRAEVYCAIATEATSTILYPFVERELHSLQPDWPAASSLRDATGLYGRGGIACDGAGQQQTGRFHDRLGDYLRERRVVSTFDRYHPVIGNEAFAAPATDTRDIGGFVVVPLMENMQTIEAGYKSARRGDLRKSERAGVQVEFETGTDHLDDFLRVHLETMKRNAAGDFYYFDRQFYEALAEYLPNNILFAYAAYQDEIVSSDLILVEPPFAHLFLSGTLADHFDKSPNTKLKHETLRYLKQIGCEYFLLGGGQKADDGIFKYKASYAPNGSLPSLIGGTVYLPDEYESLREEYENRHGKSPNGRFQFYDDA